jgi:hypothetical protein
LILGIVIGAGLTCWYLKSEIEAYEEENEYLKKLNEQHRLASDEYIRKLTVRNKELENQLYHS